MPYLATMVSLSSEGSQGLSSMGESCLTDVGVGDLTGEVPALGLASCSGLDEARLEQVGAGGWEEARLMTGLACGEEGGGLVTVLCGGDSGAGLEAVLDGEAAGWREALAAW